MFSVIEINLCVFLADGAELDVLEQIHSDLVKAAGKRQEEANYHGRGGHTGRFVRDI